MRRLSLLLAALLLLVGVAQASRSAGTSVSAVAGREPLLATRDFAVTSRLFFADPVSLRPIDRRSLPLSFHWGDFARSPDGRLLALSRNDRPELEFVRLPGLRFAGAMSFPDGEFVRFAAWPSRHVLLALLDPLPQRVVAIDPVSRTLLWQRSVGGSVLDVARFGDGLVVLAAPADGIGSARIVTIGVDGSVRSVVLERVFAGFRRDDDAGDFVGETRVPGLAVDLTSSRAYVVGAGEPIAQVELASMSVTSHGGSRTLAKAVSGPMRLATWLGNGLLAVTGTDSSIGTDAQGHVQQTMTPSGLFLVDTHTWEARMLQPDASTATTVGGSLLAYGASYESASDTRTGSGLTIYGLDGARRIHLFGETPIYGVQGQGGIAYVWLPDRNGHVVVVDSGSGRILANVTRPDLALLVR